MSHVKNPPTSSIRIMGFVPSIVVQYLIDNLNAGQLNRALPDKQTIRSVVMYANISGFTKISETLSKLGPEGNEVLAFALNRYMELLVQSISRSGGDIFKFAGDALIIIWPPPINVKNEIEMEFICRQAIQSALDIQAKLNDTNIIQNIKFSVKIGFGIGDIDIIYVGGIFNRSEFIATGDPLIQAFECEAQATSGGQTIISEAIFNLVGKYFNCEVIESTFKHHFVKSLKLEKNKITKLKMRADAQLIKGKIQYAQFEQIRPQLLTFIPAAVQPYVKLEQEKWSAELRRVTVMFVNIEIEFQSDEVTLMKIQHIIQNIQKSVYYYQGSLNKFLSSNKGSTLIIVFGLPPMSHQDDPLRAILTAQTIQNLLKVKCSFGIATGTVYTGLVGASGSRREYSVLGDSVNIASRLMQVACQGNKIILDQGTAEEASSKIPIQFLKKIKIKGKDKEVSLYEVEQNSIYQLRVHNPFFPKKENPLQIFYAGREKIIETIMQPMNEYICGNLLKMLIVISGPCGIGKTQTINLLLNSILRRIPIKKNVWKYNEQIQILVQFIECSQEKFQQFNGLKQVIAQIIDKLIARGDTLDNLKEKTEASDDDWNFLVEHFLQKKNLQIKNFPNQSQIIYPPKSILSLIIKLLSIMTEEIPPKLAKQNNLKSSFQETAPLILCFDDFQYYDESSQQAIRKILKNFSRILIIGISL